MKSFTTILLGVFLVSMVLGEDSVKKGELTLTVTGIKPSQGEVHIGLFDSKKTYTKKAMQSGVVKVVNGTAKWTAKNLRPGDFAIALFHDANSDDKLNKNLIGIPKEDYGFSNNARGTLGAPSWNKAKFLVKEGSNTHKITLNKE